MKIKNWLIHKLGGITLEDTYREQHNLVQYKQSDIVTYISSFQFFKYVAIKEDWIREQLAQSFLENIKENIEIKCIDIPEKDMIEYRGILRVVKVE